MRQRFLIHEFAARAKVTIKALHVYDRLGLLVPSRSEAGHRIYTQGDFKRLEHIITLKRLGVPLRRIKAILAGGDRPLDTVLRQQRRVLERRRKDLDHLIRALIEHEAAPAATTLSMDDILDSLAGRLTARADDMRKYFWPAAWPEARQYYENWPSQPLRQLYEDTIQALDAHPDLPAGSALAQALAHRWLELDRQEFETPGVRLGIRRAWADRHQWPEPWQAVLAELEDQRVTRFITEAIWERWDAERLEKERAGGVRTRVSEARRTLYRDGAALIGCDPASADVQHLLARWQQIVDDEIGGDAAMKAEMVRSFKARSGWPAGFLRSVASCYDLDVPTWSGVADLIEAAYDHAIA